MLSILSFQCIFPSLVHPALRRVDADPLLALLPFAQRPTDSHSQPDVADGTGLLCLHLVSRLQLSGHSSGDEAFPPSSRTNLYVHLYRHLRQLELVLRPDDLLQVEAWTLQSVIRKLMISIPSLSNTLLIIFLLK